MKRRKFVQTLPVAVAAGAVTREVEAAEPRELPDDFALLSREVLQRRAEVNGEPQVFSVHHFVVSCPYVAGSRMFLPISDHQGGQLVVSTPKGTSTVGPKPRRVIFPTVLSGPDDILDGFIEENYGVEDRIQDVYDGVVRNGFDSVEAGQAAWKVVWVEFLCTDGKKEHIITGLPDFWDSELPLDLMCKKRIR